MVVVLWLTLEREPMRLSLLAEGDWLIIAYADTFAVLGVLLLLAAGLLMFTRRAGGTASTINNASQGRLITALARSAVST